MPHPLWHLTLVFVVSSDNHSSIYRIAQLSVDHQQWWFSYRPIDITCEFTKICVTYQSSEKDNPIYLSTWNEHNRKEKWYIKNEQCPFKCQSLTTHRNKRVYIRQFYNLLHFTWFRMLVMCIKINQITSIHFFKKVKLHEKFKVSLFSDITQ